MLTTASVEKATGIAGHSARAHGQAVREDMGERDLPEPEDEEVDPRRCPGLAILAREPAAVILRSGATKDLLRWKR